MNEKKKSPDDMAIKEALVRDASEMVLRSSTLIDPAPAPFIPVTPIVVAKKALSGLKKAAAAIKKPLE